MKNTKIALALAAVALAGLTACETPETAQGGNPAQIANKADTRTEAERIDDVIESIVLPQGFVMQDGGYYEYAELVCQGLEDGLDPVDMALIGAESFGRYDATMHAQMVGASAGALCPEYRPRFE